MMEKSLLNIKSLMPIIVKNAAEFFEISLTIKLFGVKVFSFTWPPKQNPSENEYE